MVDASSLLFMVGGALTYPLFLHISFRKSLSLASKENVVNGRVLLSLVILYLETAALGILIALLAIVFFASYALKSLFSLSFRRGILAFALWQVLCLALGATLVTAVLAAMFQTILTMIPILALILLAWWMWGGKLRIGAGGNKGHGIISLEHDKNCKGQIDRCYPEPYHRKDLISSYFAKCLNF